MRSATRIDSAMFHLTPTRTRCELFVLCNGNKVKVASGLVNPFVNNLKAAKEQMSKGGYSIVIEPEYGTEALWFTKGTIERFVRFVSTPEVLERVHSLELEMLQIDETIALQKNSDAEESSVKPKPQKLTETKSISDQIDEKSLVLYEGEENSVLSSEANDEENSKVQLLKVLENRKIMLQKEQGMAFARAAAADFSMEHMSHLMLFSDAFGAQRLKDACIKYIELWKRKHETGQWVEIDASEVMARSDFSAMNASGIILENGKPNNGYDVRHDTASDQQHSFAHPEYYHGQYPPPMFPPWPMHSPQGAFPGGYTLQSGPYNPYYNPHFPQQPRRRRHSMDDDMDYDDVESWDKGRSQDDAESESNEYRRRGSRRGKKISSAPIKISESASGSGDEDDGKKSYEEDGKKSYEEEIPAVKREKSGGQWDAFQNFLLKDAEENESRSKRDMFASESVETARKSETVAGDDPLCKNGRYGGDNPLAGKLDFNNETYGSTGKVRDSDDFIMHGKSKQDFGMGSDPLVMNRFGREMERSSSRTIDDNSFVVALRQGGLDQGGSVQPYAHDMESEFTSEVMKPSGQPVYEPRELSLMPKRTMEKETAGYDPSLDFAVHVSSSVDESETVEAIAVAEPEPEPITPVSVQPKVASKPGEKKKVARPVVKGRSLLDDAKSRADKMRSYKADLQVLKKEKENEQIKRLEALKLERQKRIAARSGSVPPSNSKKTLSPLSVKASPSSKFSDASPGSSSPLQRTVRTLSSPASSVSISDPSNRLSRSISASPATGNGTSSDKKASLEKLRRLSEPKAVVQTPAPAVKAVKKTEAVPKVKPPNGSESRRISAIVNHDKDKGASLPELKISSKPMKPIKPNKPEPKPQSQKVKENGVVKENSEAEKGKDEKSEQEEESSLNDAKNDVAEVEKTVVMLEEVHDSSKSVNEEIETATDDTPNNDFTPPVDEEIVNNAEVETEQSKPAADHVASSTDVDSATLQPVSVQIAAFESSHMTQSNGFQSLPEIAEKPKESSKVFRRLLKFGRKSHNSDHPTEQDSISASGSEPDDTSGHSSEVYTLKNLISQDEATPNKSSRHFSLLSPFRSKSGEKKQTA